MKNMVIKSEDIRTRKTWGKVKPFSRLFKDRKKEKDRQACRGRVNP